MESLPHPDALHCQAATGWLELGNSAEARGEIERITPASRAHPDVLEVWWHIHAKEKEWAACAEVADEILQRDSDRPNAWIHRSFALHELKRTQEAFDQLLPVATRWPDIWTIPYNLACYCAQLGRVPEARDWLSKAMKIDGRTVREHARRDPDLEPLFGQRGRTGEG